VKPVQDSVLRPEGVIIPSAAWQQTPLSVCLFVLALRKRLDILETCAHQDSTTSSRLLSAELPSKKRLRGAKAIAPPKARVKLGHGGYYQIMWPPTVTMSGLSAVCSCGQPKFANLTLYHTHQVIAFPVILPQVTHWRLSQGRGLSCGKLCKAALPADQTSGYSSWLTDCIGELTGIVGASRSVIQDLMSHEEHPSLPKVLSKNPKFLR
jgi:hypothetical protein